jgi:DNA topoisomerase-3
MPNKPITLWIAEKPDAGKKLAAHLAQASGVTPVTKGSTVVIGCDRVTWVQGHVLENCKPEEYDAKLKSWSLATLPFVPKSFKLKPVDKTRHLLSNVKNELANCDEIVHFGDPDQEGQLLVDEVLDYLGIVDAAGNSKKPVRRLWASALDPRTLSKAIGSIKDNADYRGWYHAALSRSHLDWLFGMNLTRAVTKHAEGRGYRGDALSVGRVQTPVLGLIVRREKELRAFKPVDFFIPWVELRTEPDFRATWRAQDDDIRLDPESRLVDRKAADAIVAAAKAAGKATVVSCDTAKKSESAPLPFSLQTLQSHVGRMYGFSAKNVLELAQSLYDKGIASYPRVDTEYLPVEQHADAAAILAQLAKAPLPTAFGGALRGANPALKSRAWDSKKVSAHHGIMPILLSNPGVIASLTDAEKKVYLEIVKRYVLQFWPVAQYLETVITLSVGINPAETYTARGKRYVDEAWKKAFHDAVMKDEDEAVDAGAGQKLPLVKAGDVLVIGKADLEKRTTQAPKRYTQPSLLEAMAKIYRHVSDPKLREMLKEDPATGRTGGIGTPATRDSFIETLLKRGFIVQEKQQLVPTVLGEQFHDALPPELTLPDMTARWQMSMEDIRMQKAGYSGFMSQQETVLRALITASAKFFEKTTMAGLGSGGAGAKGSKTGANGKPRFEVVQSDRACPACGTGSLRRINGPQGWFWGCGDRACNKTFPDANGVPGERRTTGQGPSGVGSAAKAPAGPTCPICKKGALARIQKKTGGYFWGCSAYRENGCRAGFNDLDGKPDLAPGRAPALGS